MDGDEDLDLLVSLLEENEEAEEGNSPEEEDTPKDEKGEPDEYDELFDAEDDASYTEEVDADNSVIDEQKENLAVLFGDVDDLLEEEEAENTVSASVPNQGEEKTNEELQAELRKLQEQMKMLQEQLQKTAIGQQSSSGPEQKAPGKSPCPPLKERKVQKLQESPCFSAQLDNPLPTAKRGNQKSKASPAETKIPPPRQVLSLAFQPLKSAPGNTPSKVPREKTPHVPTCSSTTLQPVSVETFSGLRLRSVARHCLGRLCSSGGAKCTVSCDVLITQQSECLFQGRTFSIWRLNDLRDLGQCVSLFLFGDVHKELWKTDQGMVIGLLNANPMKPKEGSDEVRGFLPISWGKKPTKKNTKHKECVSQPSEKKDPKHSAAVPKRKVQTTLSNMVVRGADAIVQETRQKIGAAKRPMPCSEEFKELLAQPTFGARNLCKHWTKAGMSLYAGKKQETGFQSISASALLKQQKQKLLEARKKRSEEIQRRFLQSTSKAGSPALPSTSRQPSLLSPKPGAEFPKAAKMSIPQRPRLGTGFSEGEDILFFDGSPPPAPKLDSLAEAKKLAAIHRLRAKGHVLAKTDPNSVKRKRADLDDVLEIVERVEKNVAQSQKAEEPAQKKRREQLAYLQSEEFQKILNAKSKHTSVLKEAEAELQEQYFQPLVKKEEMEEKMRSIKEVKCRVVTCKTCNYTYFKPLETCVQDNHDYHWHDGIKRFFKCPCGNRAIALDRLPKKPCSTCGLFKWERDGMLKEKKGPKIGGETLLPRGEEQPKFLNSLK
uniref:Replication factor Mcm10 C-terminal domain-containing protein n=1 Tax=Pavo cristatus TaxID=9049 RepID=A0A8C9ESE3_PAVCR